MAKYINLLLLLIFTFLVSCENRTNVFVSPMGNAQGNGTIKKPFSTVQQAVDYVREQRIHRKNKQYKIMLREGDYFFKQTVVFNEKDSNITLTPYNNEKVRFSGGAPINPNLVIPVLGTEKEKLFLERNRAAISMIQLKKNGISNYGDLHPVGYNRPIIPVWMELFVNDVPYHLSRWPNNSFVKMGEVVKNCSIITNGDSSDIGGEFKYVEQHPEAWKGIDNIWLCGYFKAGWADDALPLSSIDLKKRTFTTGQAHRYGFNSEKSSTRWYAYNIAAELDTIGEYYIDRNEGILYFYNPGEIQSLEVSILDVPFIQIKGSTNISLKEITFGCTRAVAVEMFESKNCVLTDCVFKNIGCYAVEIANDEEKLLLSKNNGVVNCTIKNTGAGGVRLFGGDRKTLTAAGNYVHNCIIHNYNRIYKTYCPAIKITGVGNRISHNEIFNAPHNAILLNGNDHLIEYNDIHNVCLSTDDVGAFYYGKNPSERGNVLRYNYLHHIGAEGFRSAGIYHDDGACALTVVGNILYKAGSFASQIGGGSDNVYINNIFIDNSVAIKMDDRLLSYDWAKYMIQKGGIIEQRLDEIHYNRPPYSKRYPELANYWDENPAQPKRNVIEKNVFVNSELLIWENKENLLILPDNNYITNDDPGFFDKKNENFKLKNSSVILKKIPEFKQIPFDSIGPIKNKNEQQSI